MGVSDRSPVSLELGLDDLRWLRALARRLVADPHRADDAVQDTLVAALDRGPRSPGSLRSWLASVLRNAVRQERRGRARREQREALAARSDRSPSADEVSLELAQQRLLVELVQGLDEPYRTAIVLRFLRGRSPKAIAAELGIPVKTVYTRVERGLARLRAKLDRHSGGDRSTWIRALAPLIEAPLGRFGLVLSTAVIPMKVKLIAGGTALALVGAWVILPPGERATPAEAAPPPVEVSKDDQDVRPSDPISGVEKASGRSALGTVVEPPVVEPDPPAAAPVLLVGQVREADGRAVPGVRVVFEREQDRLFERLPEAPSAVSEADGSFRLPYEPFQGVPGRLSVESSVYASLSRPFLAGGPPAEVSEDVTDLTILVAPSRSYAGLVLDPAGEPVAGARITISLDGDWLQGLRSGGSAVHLLLPLAEAKSDESGAFRVDGVGYLEGSHILASRDGYDSARLDLPTESHLDLRLNLTRAEDTARTLFGLVLDANGTPAPETLVSVGWSSVRSGEDGRFALEMPHWYTDGFLRAVRQGALPSVVPLDWELTPDGKSRERPLTVYLGGEPGVLRGRVVDAQGEPLEGVHVWTPDTAYFGRAPRETAGGTVVGETTIESIVAGTNRGYPSYSVDAVSGPDGRFELAGLTDREYTLFAMDEHSLASAGPVVAHPRGGEVELQLGGGEPRRVAGRLVSMGGTPLSGVKVSLGRALTWDPPEERKQRWIGSPLPAPGAGRYFVDEGGEITDDEGRFAFEGVHVDRSYLVFTGPTVLMADSFSLDDAPDLEHIEVRLEAASRFRVVLDNPLEADAFSMRTPEGGFRVLTVEVDGHTLSVPHVEILDGRSGLATANEGPCFVVLLKDGEEVRRIEHTLTAGSHELRF